MKFTFNVSKFNVGVFALVLVLILGAGFAFAQVSHQSTEVYLPGGVSLNTALGTGFGLNTRICTTSNGLCAPQGGPTEPNPWFTGTGGDLYYNGGDVGIGISNPTSKLHVNGAVNSTSLIVGSSLVTSGSLFSSGDLTLRGGTAANNEVILRSGSSGQHTLTLFNSGNVEVSNNLVVLGYAEANSLVAMGGVVSSPGDLTLRAQGASGDLLLETNGVNRLTITPGGAVTVPTSLTAGSFSSGYIRAGVVTSYNSGAPPVASGDNTLTLSANGGVVLAANDDIFVDSDFFVLPKHSAPPESCSSSNAGAVYFDTNSNGDQIPCACSFRLASWRWRSMHNAEDCQ